MMALNVLINLSYKTLRKYTAVSIARVSAASCAFNALNFYADAAR